VSGLVTALVVHVRTPLGQGVAQQIRHPLIFLLSEGRMSTVYGYARVSTDDQSNSFETQKQRIEDYYKYHSKSGSLEGTVFGGVFADEDVSGGIPLFDRPAGGEMHLRLRDGDHIICVALDRCFRGVVDALLTQESLLNRNIFLHIMSVGIDFSSPIGRLMYTTLASYAEFEREMIKQRTKIGMQKKIKDGLPVNQHPPIGYRQVGEGKDSHFEPDWSERATAVQIVEWRDVHQWPWLKICKKLAFATKRNTGGTWGNKNVRQAYHAAKDNFPLHGGMPDPFTVEQRLARHSSVMS